MILIRYDGKYFTSRKALACHLAGITGRSRHSCNKWLRQFDDDPQKVIEHTGKARRNNIITFENRTYSRRALACHLAGITGHSWQTCKNWLRQFDDDPQKVIEHAKTASFLAPAIIITFENRTYSRQALAKRLAEITGRSWEACDWRLREFDDDPQKVIEHAKTAKCLVCHNRFEAEDCEDRFCSPPCRQYHQLERRRQRRAVAHRLTTRRDAALIVIRDLGIQCNNSEVALKALQDFGIDA